MTDKTTFAAAALSGMLSNVPPSYAHHLDRDKLCREAWEWAERMVANEPKPPEPARTDDWIEWGGGECPVPARTLVGVDFRDGSSIYREAGRLEWDHDGSAGDVIRYRVRE